MALADLNARIEAATVQLEQDVAEVTSKVGDLSTAVDNASSSAATATTKAADANTSASASADAAVRSEAALAAIDSKGFITDAPSNGNQYARKDGEWSVVTGGGGGGGAVDSVNGQVGVVNLTASDVGALPASTPLFSGDYVDLTNKPALFSGAYADLTGKPVLATVATSGSYADLTNKPTIIGEAPADGSQYARKDGEWSLITSAGVPVNPTLKGTVTMTTATGTNGVTFKGTSESLEIAIPSPFVGGTPDAVLAYRLTGASGKWVISKNGGAENAIATLADITGPTSLPTPMPILNSVYPTGIKLRFSGQSATEIGLDALTASNAVTGTLTYSSTTSKWMLKHVAADTASPVATEKYVTDAVAAGGGGSSAGGAVLGRSGGRSTETQRTQVVTALIPDVDNPSGATNTWAKASAALATYGLTSGGSFLFSNPAFAAVAARFIAYTYPLTSDGSPKATAATHRLEVLVNRDAAGAISGIDFIWWNLTDGTKHFKQCNSGNFANVNNWVAIP